MWRVKVKTPAGLPTRNKTVKKIVLKVRVERWKYPVGQKQAARTHGRARAGVAVTGLAYKTIFVSVKIRTMPYRIRRNRASFRMYQQRGSCSLTTILTRNLPLGIENKEKGFATLSTIDRPTQNYSETLRITKRESLASSPSTKKKSSRWLLYLLVAIYVVLPIWFSFCPWLRRQVIFLNNVNFEFYLDMKSPEKLGFPCAKNFIIQTDHGAQLGAWHIPPRSVTEKMKQCHSCSTNDTIQDLDFSSDRPIFLYFHGTGFSRAAFFRRAFYQILSTSSIDAHVVAFDPRGYADSTPGKVSVSSLVEDSVSVYNWLRKRVANPERIVIWGHSMGSGVAVHLAHQFAGKEEQPKAIILESTFTNMVDAVNSFPFSALHRFWPCFEHHVAKKSGYHPDTYIANDQKISVAVASPILILHSEDDNFLWVEQARRLYHLGNRAVDDNPRAKLFRPRYVEFEASLGYGHKAHEDPQVPDIVNGFLADVKRHSNISIY